MKYAKMLLAAAFCVAGTFIAAQGPAKPQVDKKAPAVKKAEAKKPEAKKPAPKKQEAKKPAPKKQEAKKPEAKKTEAKKPAPKKPAPKKQEAKKPAPKKQEVNIPRPKNDFAPPPPKKPAEKKAPVYKISRLIPHILIISNSSKPHFLANYCCKELDIPYILIVDKTDIPNANARLALFLPKAKEPIMLTAKDLSRLLAYIRAREVILLGNTDYIPAYYRKAVPSTSRIFTIDDADWSENTLRLASILRADKLKRAYRDYKAECERRHREIERAKKNLRRDEEALRDFEGH